MQKPPKSTKPFSPREEYMAYLLRLTVHVFDATGVNENSKRFASPALIKEFLIENDKANIIYDF